MSDQQDPKTGKFKPGNKLGRGSKPRERGLAGDVRKHRKLIVNELLKLAKDGSATAKARALSELARIGWGQPATAKEMGAVEPVGVDYAALPGVVAGYTGNARNAVLAEAMRKLHRLAGDAEVAPGVWEPAEKTPWDMSKLSLVELRALEYLEAKAKGEPSSYEGEVVILARQRYAHEKVEVPYVNVAGDLVRTAPTAPVAAPAPPAPPSPPPPAPTAPEPAEAPLSASEPDQPQAANVVRLFDVLTPSARGETDESLPK